MLEGLNLVSRTSIKFYNFIIQIGLWFEIDLEDFEMEGTEVLLQF